MKNGAEIGAGNGVGIVGQSVSQSADRRLKAVTVRDNDP